MAIRFVATINTPGYMPWADEPAVFDTAAEAWQYLLEEWERMTEDTDCSEELWSRGIERLREYRDASTPDTNGTGYVWLPRPDLEGSSHDLGLAFSVDQVEEGDETEEV